MAADLDRMRVVALWGLATVEYGLAQLDHARDRVRLRRFLRDNPSVTIHPPRYPDGEP